MGERFELHPQLTADCHVLGRVGQAHLLLHKNALVPWLILVPEVEQQEFLELGSETQAELLRSCSRLGAFVKRRFGCEKLNFAGIGNMVSQLHLHIVGRSKGDACWPAPVWGNLLVEAAYPATELAALRAALTDEVALETTE